MRPHGLTVCKRTRPALWPDSHSSRSTRLNGSNGAIATQRRPRSIEAGIAPEDTGIPGVGTVKTRRHFVDLADSSAVQKSWTDSRRSGVRRFGLIDRGELCRSNDIGVGNARSARAGIDSLGYRNPSGRKEIVSRWLLRRPSPIWIGTDMKGIQSW